MYLIIKLKLLALVMLLTIVFIPDKAVCQTELVQHSGPVKYSIGAGLGINNFHIKDEYVSPYSFRGGLFSSLINFQAESGSNTHRVDIFFSTGWANPDKQTFKSLERMGSLSYSFMHQFCKWDVAGSRVDLFLGAGLSSFAMNSDLTTDSKSGAGGIHDQTWYWAHSFNLYAKSAYALSENQAVSFTLNLPFYKVVSRPANGHWLDYNNSQIMSDSFIHAAKGGKGEFLWDNLILLCSIEYTQQLSSIIALHGTYGFNFTSSDTPMQMNMYMNNFLIGIDVLL